MDAAVFGYLAPLLKLPLPEDRLQLHLKGCPNLVRFIESMISIYLPLSDEGCLHLFLFHFQSSLGLSELTEQRKTGEEWERRRQEAKAEIREAAGKSEPEPSDEKEFPLRSKVMFALTALFLSAMTAVHLGLVKVEVREVDEEQD